MSLPSSLSLTTIADGSPIIASTHRNNYSALQTTVNGLIADLVDGSAAGQALVWDATNSKWTNSLIKDANVDPAAAIAASKIAAGYPVANLGSFPGGTTNFLRADGTFAAPPSGGTTITSYRQTTAPAVLNTTAATDLLNGGITIGAGKLGANSTLRATLAGYAHQTIGGTLAIPRFQVVIGGTVVLDTNTASPTWNGGGWDALRLDIYGYALGATNSQIWMLDGSMTANAGITAANASMLTGNAGGVGTAPNTGAQWHVAGAASIDMTVARTFVVNVINGSSTATYETGLYAATIDIF